MQKPNIVYILADDMGYGDCSCLNQDSRIRTVHLDQLCRDGLHCTDAHASSAVCTPSRYSILTGRYNWRSQLKQGVLDGYGDPLIEDRRMTVASFLRDRGYATACIGKWHLGLQWQRHSDRRDDVDYTAPMRGGPCDHGFDHFHGIAASLDMPPYAWISDDRLTEQPTGWHDGADGQAMSRPGPMAPGFDHAAALDVSCDHACDWIRQQAGSGRPFFLYFPLTAPHTPVLPAVPFRGTSGLNDYGDFCLHVDDVVGRIMATLAACGVSEDTILVFTADNGCSPKADFPALAEHGHHPSHHFRGMKADIYEGGHRIPLLIRWPRAIAAGSRCDELVCLGDLLATVADIHGVDLPDEAGEDSISNLPLWQGEQASSAIRERLLVHHSFRGAFAIRQGGWKLEMCPGSGGWSWPRPGPECDGLPPMQLYDLSVDIGERSNLLEQEPEVVERLQAALSDIITRGRTTPGAPQANTGPTHWPQLWWMAGQEAQETSA